MTVRNALLIVATTLSVAACKKTEPPAPSASTSASAPTTTVAATASAGAVPSAAATASASNTPAGPRPVHAERLTNGEIKLTGTDKWGGSLDATYENLDYFRRAIPVLSRSVTPEQAADLENSAKEFAKSK